MIHFSTLVDTTKKFTQRILVRQGSGLLITTTERKKHSQKNATGGGAGEVTLRVRIRVVWGISIYEENLDILIWSVLFSSNLE